METLEELEARYKRELSYRQVDEDFKQINQKRKELKKKVRSLEFQRKNPILAKSLSIGQRVARATGEGLSRMAEAQRRQEQEERKQVNRRYSQTTKTISKPRPRRQQQPPRMVGSLW